jgi:four helix bundle protein
VDELQILWQLRLNGGGTGAARHGVMNEKAEALKARTKQFALDVLALVEMLPREGPVVAIGRQLTASGTSVAANYRAACRARSRAEFAAKIGVALEEADESAFWLELLDERRYGPPRSVALLKLLRLEAGELSAILAASSITARQSLARARQ